MVIHCAARSDPHTHNVFCNNVNLTKKILETVKCDHFIFLSTGLVYGDCKWEKYEEDLLLPQSEYALSKQVCEDLVRYYARKNHFKHTIIRPCPVLGPGMTHGLITDLEKLPDHAHIKLRGTNFGSIRSYVHIEDFVNIVLSCIEKSLEYTINVSNTDYISSSKLVKTLYPDCTIEWDNNQNCTDALYMNTDRLKTLYELKYNNCAQVLNAYINSK